MLKAKRGATFWVASKHDASSVDWTVTAPLVPPEPKPEASLTWERKESEQLKDMINA